MIERNSNWGTRETIEFRGAKYEVECDPGEAWISRIIALDPRHTPPSVVKYRYGPFSGLEAAHDALFLHLMLREAAGD